MGGLVVGVAVLAGVWLLMPTKSRGRGRRLLPEQKSLNKFDGIPWGGRSLPDDAATSHFLVLGTTGSGKTLTIKQLMERELPRIGGGDSRALIYDAKQDVLSYLSRLNLRAEVLTLNPFDRRGVRWDLARDITSPASALQFASILIPEESGNNRFFSDAGRDLLAGVIKSFIQCAPGTWSLRDLVLAMRRRESMQELLAMSVHGEGLIEAYFQEERTLHNILSTVRSRLAPFEPIAALWDQSSTSVSLEEWSKGEFILILASNESVRIALDAVNRALFKRMSELIVSQPESRTRRTWFFLDEVREAGKLPGLTSLLTKGRSKGACVVLGLQDIDGLREAYGSNLANEICGMCSNKAVLRLESPETAAWASKMVGEYESIEHLRSVSSDATFSRRNRTKSETRVRAAAVLPSEFLSLPPTTRETGLSGYYLSPNIGAFRSVISIEPLVVHETRAGQSSVRDFDARPDSDQYLTRWSASDMNRLQLESNETEKVDARSPNRRLQLKKGGLASVQKHPRSFRSASSVEQQSEQ